MSLWAEGNVLHFPSGQEPNPIVQRGIRYLDLDGDGADEALVPLKQIDPPSDGFWEYGIARKTETGEWNFIEKKGATESFPNNAEIFVFSYMNPFVAFDSACGKKRVFSEWSAVGGISGFHCLIKDGVMKLSREKALKHLRVGEIHFLKGLKVIQEQPSDSQTWKVVALCIGEDGYLSVSKKDAEASVLLNWTADTCGAKHKAFPMPLLSIPFDAKDKIAGVIFHGSDERLLGVLFDEDAGGTLDCHLYGSPADGNLLEPNRFDALDRYVFSKESDRKILTEFFCDDGRIREGKPLPVIWFERYQYGYRIVRPQKRRGKILSFQETFNKKEQKQTLKNL